jgi:hypothetical protein
MGRVYQVRAAVFAVNPPVHGHVLKQLPTPQPPGRAQGHSRGLGDSLFRQAAPQRERVR